MTEALASEPDAGPVRTGVPEVDSVLESVDGLEGTDVAGHPEVFEQAHEQLRSALDGHA